MRKLPARQRVLIVLKSGTTVRGVLWEASRDFLEVRDAAIHARDGSSPGKADGAVVVERRDVDFYQFPEV